MYLSERGIRFWSFSQIFRIPLQLILHSNRNINPANLSVGQKIQIPGFVAVRLPSSTGRLLMVDCPKAKSPSRYILLVNPSLNQIAYRWADHSSSNKNYLEACKWETRL